MEKNKIQIHISISEQLYNDIKEYCKLNNLKINVFINELLSKSFIIEKHGESPFDKFKTEYNTLNKVATFKNEYMGNFTNISESIPKVIDEKLEDDNVEEFIEKKSEENTQKVFEEEEKKDEPKVAIKPKKRRRLK